MTLDQYYVDVIKKHPNLDVINFTEYPKEQNTTFVGIAGSTGYAENLVCQQLINLDQTVIDPDYFQVVDNFLNQKYNPFLDEFNNTKFRSKDLKFFPSDVYSWIADGEFGNFSASKSRLEFFTKHLIDPYIEWVLSQNTNIEADVLYVHLPRGSFTFNKFDKIVWLDVSTELINTIEGLDSIPNMDIMSAWMNGFVKPKASTVINVPSFDAEVIADIAGEVINGSN